MACIVLHVNPFLFRFLCIEPSSGFWYPGTSQSRDLSAPSNSDAQSCETQVVWSPKQKEMKENIIHRGRLQNMLRHEEGRLEDLLVPFTNQPECPSSSLNDVSLKLFGDEDEESKLVSMLPVAPGNSTSNHTMKLGNECLSKMTESGKRSEPRNGCRLFGIELMDSSNNSPALEKTLTGLFSISGATTVALTQATISATDSDHQPGPSKASKEHKHSLQLALKDIQSRQTCSATRSCTKVKHLKRICAVSNLSICLPH